MTAGDIGIETNRFLTDTTFNNLLKTVKCTAADEQNVRSINMIHLLLRMFSSALRRNAGIGTLKNLQKSLLYPFAGYITGNGSVLRFTGNFVDLVDIDNSVLCTLNIIIGSLNDFQKNIFHVFTDIAGFRKRCCICNCKRDVENLRQSLCQIRLAGTGRSDHQNVALLQFNIQILLRKHALIVIVDSNGKHTLCLVLSNHILIQKLFHLRRLNQIDILL